MAQFLTDKYIKYRAAIEGRVIKGDKPCEQCAYNLRGLRYNGACPECGTPIRYRRDPSLKFHEMPLPLIKGFRTSGWMAFGAVAGALVLWMTGSAVARPRVALGVTGALLAMWLLAVWRLTSPSDAPQAAAHGFSPRSRLRLAARWLQVAWVLAVGAKSVGLFKLAPAGAVPAFDALAVAGVALGLVAVAVLSLFLARLAYWVGEELAAKAFNTAVWGSLSVGVLLLVLPPFLIGLGGLPLIIVLIIILPLLLLLLASVLTFPFGLLVLSRSIDWSVVHARQRLERDRRMRQRLVPRSQPLPEPQDPISLTEAPPQGGPQGPPGLV